MNIPESVLAIAGQSTVKPIDGHDGYFISDSGQVISTKIHGNHFGTTNSDYARILKPQTIKRGAQVVFMHKRYYYIARLVLHHFIGECPPKFEACHNDGNPANNQLSNLRWDTHTANMADMRKHGTYSAPPRNVILGNKNGASKLNADNVNLIRLMIQQGIPFKDIAGVFSVSDRTISDINRGKSWSWLK